MIVRVTIDVEALRQELLMDAEAAFYGGGYGGAMMEAFEIERATPQELVAIAERAGVDVRKYIVDDDDDSDDDGEEETSWEPWSW